MFSDRDLQVLPINDFSPGIVRFSRGLYPTAYALGAPPGSAAVAYRCFAIPGVGLGPFCAYRPALTWGRPANATYQQMLSIGNLMALEQSFGSTQLGDSLVVNFYTFLSNAPNADFCDFNRVNVDYPAVSGAHPMLNVYSQTSTGSGGQMTWPTMDRGAFHDPAQPLGAGYQNCIFTNDPKNGAAGTAGTWLTIGDWLYPTPPPPPYTRGTLPGPAAYDIRTLYHQFRVVYITSYTPQTDTLGFGGPGSGVDGLWISGQMDLSSWTFAGLAYPEMGHSFGVWGSISTGELFLLYDQGGAVLIYGDLGNIQSIYKLPGVPGAGHVWGPGALTPAGLIYATETDGAYAWNGDNTAKKISTQIPDDLLFRSNPPSNWNAFRQRSSQVAWGSQVMFPNNWVYDTITGSWWQVEDPGVVNFQVHAESMLGPKAFYSAQGWQIFNAGQTPALTVYQWDRLTPQSSYVWISNPLPVTQGALVSIQTIELVASNTSSHDCQVIITPTIPPGQRPFQQQNNNQPGYYTIPANTIAWRGSQRFGHTDYNVQLRIDASNLTANQPAPVIHEINIGHTTTRPSGTR